MRIIIDGHGRIDRQAMAVERLKTIDMTPAGGGGRPGLGRRMARRVRPGARPVPRPRNTSAGARYGSLEPTSKAFDRLMQEHKKERETKGARP